ncbi:MAG: oxidoreductase [Flavobacteriaceae bacterium]|nr:oxidoreductase [Flavobacteriaceae bacterium]
MKRILALLIIIVFISSCQKEYQPRTIDSVSIEEYKIDSVSIRAILPIDRTNFFYADSKGNIGFTKSDGKNWEKNTFIHIEVQDTIVPNFRSIATNGESIFALSIGNPALLYKIGNDQSKGKIVYKEEHEKVFYDSMKFFDKQNGIAMGDPTEDCLSIILTTDGGNTWNKIPCDKLPKVVEGEAAFAASNTNIKVLGKTVWIVTGGAKARVFKSVDLGQTWEVFDTPIIQGDGPQGIYSVDFADENNGIIIGGDYSKPEGNKQNKAMTNDGGKTWTLVADGQNPAYKSCVKYVPDTNGKEVFAVGKTGVSYSNDGGLTWKEVSKDSYYTIEFADRNTAWLSGNQKIGKLILD